MGFNDIESKLEAATKTLVVANITALTASLSTLVSANVHTGLSADDLVLPRIVIIARQGDENPIGTGNFDMECSVKLHASADDSTLVQHRAVTATLRDLFQDTAIATTLSALATDFTVLNVREFHQEQEHEGRRFVSTLQFTANACGSDL